MSKKPSDIVSKTNLEFDRSASNPAIGMTGENSADSQYIEKVVEGDDSINVAVSLIQIFNARERHLPIELDGLGEKGWNI